MIRHIHIVDDDESVRASLLALLGRRSDMVIHAFPSGDALLRRLTELEPGVVLLDMNMPGTSGMDVLRRLVGSETRFETIVITGHGNIAMAVEAMRAGAFDFLEKPYDHRALLQAIDLAYARLEDAVQSAAAQNAARERLATLSARERDVLLRLIEGRANKMIAQELGLSPRTVEYYRANLMTKLGVRSLSEGLKVAFAGGLFSESRL
jgi:two-component system response regulator FixJ